MPILDSFYVNTYTNMKYNSLDLALPFAIRHDK